jgi:HEAT repeat protein
MGSPGAVGRRGRLTSTSGSKLIRWEVWWEWNKERFLGIGKRRRLTEPGSKRGPVFLGRDAKGPIDERERLRRWRSDRVLPVLRRQAVSGHQVLRLAGVYALGLFGERVAMPDLVSALADGSLDVRRTALLALGMSGEPYAVPILVDVVKGKLPGVGDQMLRRAANRERATAALALGLIGDARAIDPLRKVAFQRSSWRDLRGAALLGLGLIRDAESRKLLSRALKVQRFGTTERTLVATAFGYQGDPEALAPLYRLMRDRVAEVRRAAVLAVGAFPRQAILLDNLAEVKQRLANQGLSPYAREQLKERVQEIRERIEQERKAEGVVWNRIRNTLRYLMNKDADRAVQALATVALGQVGEPEDAEPVARKLVKGAQEVRSFAALALGCLARTHGDRAAHVIPLLRKQFGRTGEISLRGAIAVALGLAGDTQSASKLTRLLEPSTAPSVRAYAATALGLIGDRSHAGAVARALARARHLEEIQNEALGLSLIGGPKEVKFLEPILFRSTNTHEQVAVASGLAFLGGREVLTSLSRFVSTRTRPSNARAFATEGLGIALDFRDPTQLARITIGYNFLHRISPVDWAADLKW